MGAKTRSLNSSELKGADSGLRKCLRMNLGQFNLLSPAGVIPLYLNIMLVKRLFTIVLSKDTKMSMIDFPSYNVHYSLPMHMSGYR